MAWVWLALAGVLEIVFALSLKFNGGFTKLWPTVVTAVAGAASFYILTLAIKTLPIGTAYAVWTGIGVVGVAIAGVLLFEEPAGWLRLASISLVLAGIVGLKITDGG